MCDKLYDKFRWEPFFFLFSFSNSAVVSIRESWKLNPVSTLICTREFGAGVWNGFLRYTLKKGDISRKKLHGVIMLTKIKFYLYTWKGGGGGKFEFFSSCRDLVI